MAALSRQVAEALQELNAVIQSLKVGPKLVMYFRPNAPQWWDYTEKKISAHAAYHRHQRFSYYRPGMSDNSAAGAGGGDREESAERAQAEVGQAVSQVEDVLKRLGDLKLGGPPVTTPAARDNARADGQNRKSAPPPVAPKPVGVAKRPRPDLPGHPKRQLSAPDQPGGAADSQGPSTTPKPSAIQQPILDSAMGIADAIAKLLRYSQLAQKELAIKHAAEASADGFDGGVATAPWSQAFVTAAKHVAAAVHHLCETANAVVLGRSSEERLIAASKQVAASTAQLLVECKVRADPHSETTRRLQEAGQAVKRATERLVAQAQSAIDRSEEENRLQLGDSMVHSVKMLIEARESIFQKQRELDDMRKKYQGAWSEHQSKYPELYEEKQ